MKKLFIISVIMFMFSFAMAQTGQPCSTCLPEGIEFTAQSQIDSFQTNYPGCTEILGDVNIHGVDITNLNGLIVLTSCGGSLVIGTYSSGNPALISLSGLDNVTSIGGNLIIGII